MQGPQGHYFYDPLFPEGERVGLLGWSLRQNAISAGLTVLLSLVSAERLLPALELGPLPPLPQGAG